MYEDKDYFKPTHFIWDSETLCIDCRPSQFCGTGNVRYIGGDPPAHAGSEISLVNGIGGNFFAFLKFCVVFYE